MESTDSLPARRPKPAAPVEFHGRKAARTLNYSMAGVFLAFIGLCFFAMFDVPNRAFGVSMGGVMALSLAGLLIMPLQNLTACYSVVRLDQDGLSMVGPFRDLSVRWSDIESIRQESEADSTMRLSLTGGFSFPLRLYLYEDGDEMGKLIREKWAEHAPARGPEAKVYRRPNEGVLYFVLGMYFLIGGLAAYWLLQAPARLPSGNAGGAGRAIFLIFGLVLLFAMTLPEVGRFAQLTSTHLIVGNRWRRESIPVGRIERVDVAEGKVAVWTAGRAVSVPTALADQAELNARLAALAAVSAAPSTPAPSPLTARETFVPSRSARIGLVAMPIFFLAVVIASTAGMVADPKETGMYLFGDLVFGSFGVASAYVSLLGLARFTVDRDGIARKCALGSWRLAWDEIELAWRRGNGLNAYRFSSGGRMYDAEISAVRRPERLAGLINLHLKESRHPWANEPGHIFRNSTEGVFVALIAGTIVLGSTFYISPASHQASADVMVVCLIAFLLLLFTALAAAVLRRYETTHDGLRIRGLLSKRFLKFSDVVRVVLASSLHNKSNTRFRMMKIEHPNGGISISSQVEDYALLEAYVRKHVEPHLIRDEA